MGHSSGMPSTLYSGYLGIYGLQLKDSRYSGYSGYSGYLGIYWLQLRGCLILWVLGDIWAEVQGCQGECKLSSQNCELKAGIT
jgi:hypothetical protein